jgi:hypothetical protein
MNLEGKTAAITGSGRGLGRVAKFSPVRIWINCRERTSGICGGSFLKKPARA